MNRPTLLVVAKAPVPGEAKTRVADTIGDDAAADLAAAALLDTVDTAVASGLRIVVALTGDLTRAVRAAEIDGALRRAHVVRQVGDSFGARLARAHLDADAGHGVIQVGTDSPQMRVGDLLEAVDRLGDHASVIGPAADGGWWLLGVRRGSDASGLPSVAMSTPFTGQDTRDVLPEPTASLRVLRDVDTWDDARAVAAEIPHSRFGAAVGGLGDGARP
jgi:glycosyltransferase A (GT-A) superfamily protein (DUF2064 family)